MKVILFILQALLALHTLIGAVWKFSHTADQTMPSLAAIPQPVWLLMSVLEILCALALLLPLLKPKFGRLVFPAAVLIALEMATFCIIHIASGNIGNSGPMVYWVVVAVLCIIIAQRRRRSAS